METEAILQFVKIKDARPSLGAVKCLRLKIKLLLQVFRARCAKDNFHSILLEQPCIFSVKMYLCNLGLPYIFLQS